jgi:surfeit locus 1 family protein
MNSTTRAWMILLATLLSVASTANLGAWQMRRAAQKIALQTTMQNRAQLSVLTAAELAHHTAQAPAQHHRAVRLRGHWLPEHSVFLENRQMQGNTGPSRVGFYLTTPLQLQNQSKAVLVQRGWVPRDLRDRTLLPSVVTATGVIEITGHIAPPPARLYEFSRAASGPIRQNIDLAAYSTETGLQLLPFSVEQSNALGETDGVQKHYGYAFQWFALCALMTGLYVWFQLVRPRIKRNA